jgi:protoporphyrinogen oxidase
MKVVLGGGLAGLSAAHRLSEGGQAVTVLEKGSQVGGLSRTVSHHGFRFDLGGHRFITDNQQVAELVKRLLGEDLLTVPRSSQIFLRGQFINYPLQPLQAIRSLGPAGTMRILADYGVEQLRQLLLRPPVASLEDWVVSQFGRTMFNLYFRDYSEKVWGLKCREISQEWVAQRINGLSLWSAAVNACLRLASRRQFKTLVDEFHYPRQGIGQLSERLRAAIEPANQVLTSAAVREVHHDGRRIRAVTAGQPGRSFEVAGEEFISTIPLTTLIRQLRPAPPAAVLAAAQAIGYRALVLVTLMLDKERMTDLTWLYFPGRDIPFGRIHEPTNWSRELAPPGKTHVVAEFFCSEDDALWQAPDQFLSETTTSHLQRLGFLQRQEVIDHCVLRIPHAYPTFSLDYRHHLQVLTDYLGRFENLHLVGRTGSFSYLNMDLAMASGLETAEKLLGSGEKTAAFSLAANY